MPVEIRELQITTIIGNSNESSEGNSVSPLPDMNSIIAQCVEQVLEVLKQKNER